MSDPAGEPASLPAGAATKDASGDFERYGLVAALTLVALCLLLADRLRPSRSTATVPPADKLLRIRIGGNIPRRVVPAAPAAPRQEAPRVLQPVPPAHDAGGPAKLASADLPPAAPRTVTVRSGDTLSEISTRELGTSRRAAEIARLNGIDPAHIREGQSLRLPPR